MQIQLEQLKYEFKRSACIGLILLLFAVMGAGCATQTPPPEQGHVIIQSGQNSAEVFWPK